MVIVSDVAGGAWREGERRMPIFQAEDAALMPIFLGSWGMSCEGGTETDMLVIVCRACGKEYEPDRAEIVQGPAVYRLCPTCRTVRKDAA